jgi:hypothetical protein
MLWKLCSSNMIQDDDAAGINNGDFYQAVVSTRGNLANGDRFGEAVVCSVKH